MRVLGFFAVAAAVGASAVWLWSLPTVEAMGLVLLVAVALWALRQVGA